MDSTGGAVPGAKITATNVDTNATREAASNEAGIYSFPSMQPGKYNLRVEKSGFKTATRDLDRARADLDEYLAHFR